MERNGGGTPSVLRQLNTRLVLRTVREHGPLSRAELLRLSGLSRPTINEVVEALFSDQTIRDAGEEEGARTQKSGPRARLLEFNACAGHLLGVDVGANKVLVKLAELDGTVVATGRRVTDPAAGVSTLLGQVRGAVTEVLAAARVRRDSLRQAAISTPGVVDPASGTVRLAPQLPGWDGVDVTVALKLGCPTVVENEMHVAVLGEEWLGAAKGEKDIVYLGVGVGIGAGLMIGGHLHRGVAGAAGEIGYLPLDEGVDPPANGPGRFEAAAGAQALAARGQALARTPKGAFLRGMAGDSNLDAAVVFAAAASGDEAALELVDEVARLLARAAASLTLIIDPAVIVVGGGLSRSGDVLLEPMRKHFASLLPVSKAVLMTSELGDEAAVFGAVRLAMQVNDDRMYEEIGRNRH